MTASIQVHQTPSVKYLLRVADTCLIHSHRLSEWCGHAPVLEEDIALANMALDMLGQARALLTHAGTLELDARSDRTGAAFTEDQWAYLRDERDFFNVTLVELPSGDSLPGDFAFTVLRNHAVATWLHLMWHGLVSSSDPTVAAIAAKAVKEARYHEAHTADWVVRLGDGTDESAKRMHAALQRLWPYTAELLASDAVDGQAKALGLGPAWGDLQAPWMHAIDAVYARARLVKPAAGEFVSTGRNGTHSEHMGFILSQMQYLQRTYPGGVW